MPPSKTGMCTVRPSPLQTQFPATRTARRAVLDVSKSYSSATYVVESAILRERRRPSRDRLNVDIHWHPGHGVGTGSCPRWRGIGGGGGWMCAAGLSSFFCRFIFHARLVRYSSNGRSVIHRLHASLVPRATTSPRWRVRGSPSPVPCCRLRQNSIIPGSGLTVRFLMVGEMGQTHFFKKKIGIGRA